MDSFYPIPSILSNLRTGRMGVAVHGTATLFQQIAGIIIPTFVSPTNINESITMVCRSPFLLDKLKAVHSAE